MTTIIDALRDGIAESMAADPSVVMIGEDVRFGGTFGLTKGLVDRFGPQRVLDTPISEAGFVGLAIGAGMNGLRTVVDFQYGDFILPAANMVIQEATKLAYMSGGRLRIPLVLHAPTGATARGAQHANSIEQIFFGTPGLRVAVPSTPYDAKGMMIGAIRADVPTLICPHKHLFGAEGRYLESGYGAVGDVPSGLYEVPLGEAVVRRQGSDVTIASCLLMTHRALKAAEALASEGIDAEVVDLRSLTPLDIDGVLESAEKTGRLLVVEEGPRTGGWASTVVAEVVELVPQIVCGRVSGPDESLPAAPHLEAAHVPDAERIAAAVRELLRRRAPLARPAIAAVRS